MNLRRELYHLREGLKHRLEDLRFGDCRVLLYHRITDSSYDPQQLCVSPASFHEQLNGLRKLYRFIGIDEFSHLLTNGKRFPRGACLITFDDGYADNLLQALPILENLGLQATFYVSTANIDTSEIFWWDGLDLIYRKSENAHAIESISRPLGKGPEDYYRYLVGACKAASSLAERHRLLRSLAEACPISAAEKEPYRCMTAGELRKLASSRSAVIGAHTVNHLSLGHISVADQEYEIRTSVERLSAILGGPVKHFAFPYGEKAHFNQDTLRICRSAGLTSAAANYYEVVKGSDNVFAFPRLVIRNKSLKEVLIQLKQAPHR